ncbi:MAG: poly-gamma-glutamate biosynthesis protein PgsC/CapC [Pyramidobacter sp.]
MNEFALVTLGIGIFFSLIYEWRTGYGTGGLVSAGMLALSLYSPLRVLVCVATALLIWPVLAYPVRRYGIHGRARIGFAMLLALAVRLVSGRFIQPVPWVGWIIPGLIAADIQRQGPLETLCGLVSVSVLTAFAAQWIAGLGSVL